MDRYSKLISTDELVQGCCKGKSFIDVGPLWTLANEKLSTAYNAGATSLTAFDTYPSYAPEWTDLRSRLRGFGIEDVRCITGAATSPSFFQDCGVHDVVYCSGVIYHLASPMILLENLYKVTSDTLILNSMTVPEVIENEAGRIDLGDAGALFVPALVGDQLEIVKTRFDSFALKVHAINTSYGQPWYWAPGQVNFGPWWWLLTPSLISKMLETAGFRVEEVGETWPGRAHAFVCKRTPNF